MSFFPYLFFSGNCREAMTRYQEIFGGELFVMRMGDAPDTTKPGDGKPPPDDNRKPGRPRPPGPGPGPPGND